MLAFPIDFGMTGKGAARITASVAAPRNVSDDAPPTTSMDVIRPLAVSMKRTNTEPSSMRFLALSGYILWALILVRMISKYCWGFTSCGGRSFFWGSKGTATGAGIVNLSGSFKFGA